ALSRSAVADKVRIVLLDGAKDAGDFFERSPATFQARLQAQLANAITIQERLQADRAVAAAENKQLAGDLVRNENRGEAMLDDIEADGLVGERNVAAGTALTIVSAVGSDPASMLVKGTSGGGKSFSVDETTKRFPPEFYDTITNASEK